jgi:DNA-binding IscR family transcriptional regulator
VLALSTVDPTSVPGCRAMVRYAYDTLAAIHQPITLAELVSRVEADAEYHRRSHQPVRRHVRQLVAKLRQWGLVEAGIPTPAADDGKKAAAQPPRARGRR